MNAALKLMVREDSLQENRLLSFFGLLALRICLGIAILLFIDQIAEFETSALLLSFFLIAGVVAGGYFARYRASVIAVAMMHVLLWLLLSSVLWSWDALFVSVNSPAADDFLIYRLSSHLQLTALVYVAGLISTWTYWAKQWTDTVEAVLSCVLFIGLLAGHRNYQLDAPKQLSDLAWQLNLAPQHLILGLGAGYLLILGVYLLFSYTRPVFNSSRVERSRGKSSKVFGVLVPTILCGLIVLLAVYIDRLYSSEIDRVSEGVGMGGQTEGESPLGFHSALGQSRQPAALVRLENDFTTNPWSPMIYFREGVLSRFNGKEIVAGPTTLDADVPRISPGQPYIVVESELVPGRKEVQQSIFLLTEHKNPFALDFPISIQLLKNPDPERFNTAYQATSFAPVLNYNQMRNFAVDNPSWPKSTTEHYLRAPGSLSTEDIASADLGQDLSEPILDKHGEDLRYALMARAITASLDNPLDKARAITEFLSKVSVYTRSPGHQVTAGGDPVAAYLFAEKKRGYCVHFAHAAVYMMRLSGVPSRIATGYLTDMSYAKDGHLLLHLGDRHAWPEVYLHEYGWMAVDVSPEQAENEEPIIPDESLLEELMSKIDPGLEFLNPEDGPNLFPEDEADVLTAEAVRKGFVFSALSLLLLFFVMKLYLHYGYLLASGQSRKLALQYRAFAAQCIDIGIGRGFGETKLEHAKRLHTQEKIAGTPLAERMAELRYSKNSELEAIDTNALIKSIERSKGSIRRVLGFLNPASLFKWGRW